MKDLTKVVSLFVLLAFCNASTAQQRFKAGLVFGLNAAQIEGDLAAGYNKLALHGGVRAITVLRDKMDFVLEMLYSQRGSYARLQQGDMKINLQYVEIPLMISYKDWYQEDDDYYKVQAIGGFSYGRLIEASSIGSIYHDTEVENFNKNDYSITLGADVFLTKHFGFGARWTRSLNLLYNNQKHNPNVNGLFGYFLSFRGAYIF